MTAVRQLEPFVVGLTHAESVSALVMSRDAASATVTQSFEPSNESALPNRPAAVQVAPESDPVFPLPEPSATVVPPRCGQRPAASPAP